jgi:hypothetical protein
MGLKGYRLWVMGQLDSNVQSPTSAPATFFSSATIFSSTTPTRPATMNEHPAAGFATSLPGGGVTRLVYMEHTGCHQLDVF